MAIKKELIIDVDLIIEKYNKKNPKLQPMTRTILAEKLGVNKQLLSDWKGGRTPKWVGVLFTLMDVGDCDVHGFIIEKEV